ncbi:AAA family ATPase [Parasaccharibacter apium]|uniref:AAA family ATPase n=1 Tax=Parasaccharibacter apium TaxID=1510841 RepID=UPI0005B7BDAD|nr:AAA family ATPase [Parasaccharibacter apium]
MIRNITIADIATYPEEGVKIDNLETVNYFFGYNGCGKTTISRIIEDITPYSACKIKWTNNKELQTLVYNADFINKNISEKMAGIFTIGENNIDAKNNIDSIKEKIYSLERNSTCIKDDIEEISRELENNDKKFHEKMWNEKKNFNKYEKSFKGYNGSKEKFTNKVIEEYNNKNIKNIDEEEFRKNYNIVFSKETKTYTEIRFDTTVYSKEILFRCENSPLLGRSIVGRNDTIVSHFINAMGNSDWVHQGLNFLDEGASKCPFCQQTINDNIKSQLEKFFDTTYEKSLEEIKNINTKYMEAQRYVISFIDNIINKIQSSLDVEGIQDKYERIKNIKPKISEKFNENSHVFEKKMNNPSIAINENEIKYTAEILRLIERDVSDINALIIKHNALVTRKDSLESELDKKIWSLFINKNMKDIKYHLSEKMKNQKLIKEKNNELVEMHDEIESKAKEINNLEKSLVSVQPTIGKINKLLKTYGFKNFYIENINRTNQYTIVRPNGNDAINTLSEGEKSFISFLYFYFLIHGGISENDINQEKVIVIDDPVSSMDFNTSFIISALIKELIEKTHDKTGNNPQKIRQIFLLSHNAYFFNEVTYQKHTKGQSFWLITKKKNISSITRCKKNPVKKSYDLLWDEIRSAKKNPNEHSIGIQNICRRIIENYFYFVGDIDLKELPNKFQDDDRLICLSLINWAHDGSHNIQDSIITDISNNNVEPYLNIFEQIFIKMDHKKHYDKMMED